MTMIPKSKNSTFPLFSQQIHFDWQGWLSDHITGSWWMALWLLGLTLFTANYTFTRLQEAPISSVLILLVWVMTVAMTVYAELIHRHTAVTRWLRENLYNSITNIFLTLLITLASWSLVLGLYNYAFKTSSTVDIPATRMRAELLSSASNQFCFNIGTEADDKSVSFDGLQQCFPSSAFDAENSQTNIIESVSALGTEATNFCFDVAKDDAEHGRTCFTSVAGDPDLYEVAVQFSGANWGAVKANLSNMMVRNFAKDQLWRVWVATAITLVLVGATFVVYNDKVPKTIRNIVTYSWLISPIFFYILLVGVTPMTGTAVFSQAALYLTIIGVAVLLWLGTRYINGRYPPAIGEPEIIRLGRSFFSLLTLLVSLLAFWAVINLILLIFGQFGSGNSPTFVRVNPDTNWGGFMLTMIITAFAIVVSFPLGVLLALGRRSAITGVPAVVTYLIAAVITVWGLLQSTPNLLDNARNTFETILAYWPLAIPVLAYLFQKIWKGNVLAAFSTIFIEFIRGIPLITVLFLSIILFPIFLPDGMEFLKTWRVMWAFALFSAAYLAENVRGGLQAIPKGQYEAADSLGLNTFNKYRLIILPQALRIVIPAITGQYIGLFKDTTLVAIVGLTDILGVANSISSQPQWFGVRREAYLFIAVLYYVISAIIVSYADRLERKSGLGDR